MDKLNCRSRTVEVNDQEFSELLHKFRDEPACALQFQPSIEMFIDSRFCLAMDRILHRSGILWERLKAVPNLASQLPEETGIYMFVWKPELCLRFSSPPTEERFCWVLYVGKAGTNEGKSDTIKHRFQSEYSKYVAQDAACLWETHAAIERKERLARYLTLRPLEYWLLTISEIRDILVLEKKLIRMLRPPLNQQHGPKLRPGKPTPAFEELK